MEASLPVRDGAMRVAADAKRQATLAISIYYAALYAPVAIILTFFPLWMRGRGLTAENIGLIVGLGTVLRIVTNPVVAHIADRSGRRKPVLIALIAGAALGASLYYPVYGFLPLLAVYILTNAFSSSIMPLGESVVVISIKRYGIDYGLARRWGSVTVILLSIALGAVVERSGSNIVVSLLVVAYAALLVAALALPSATTQHEERPSAPLAAVLKQGNYVLLLGSAAMCQAAHGFFYSFGTFYWLDGGLSTTEIGWLWAGGVVSEVVIFSLARQLAGIASPIMIIGLGCLTGIVRWGLLSASHDLAMAVVVQILQGGTLAFTHIGAARYLAAAMPSTLSSSATGLYSACGYGLFMGIGVFAGGYLLNRIGGGIFLIAACVCAFGLLCAAGLGWWHKRYPLAPASDLS